MFRYLFLTGFVALAAPVLAQDMPDSSAEPSATPPPVASHGTAPVPEAPATPPPEAMPPAPPPAAARPATTAEVGAMVQSEFPARDRDGNGGLDQTEFSVWLGELVARSPSASSDEAGMQARIEAAFGSTDTDGDGSVSSAEMTALLSRAR
jgi:hypothetical protein